MAMSKLRDTTNLFFVKKEMAYFMRRLYKRGLTSALGGNISLRYEDLILITASQTDKGRVTPAEICETTIDGQPLNPKIKVSTDLALHVAIYAARPEVTAIIHAHPPIALAHAVTHSSVNTRLTSESWMMLGQPAFADYSIPGSEKMAEQAVSAIGQAKVVLLKNHGALSVGNSLIQAFDRMDVLENTARIQLYAHLIGRPQSLSNQEIEIINALNDL